MSVNIKENGNLTTVANNISIAQANWNDRGNTSKNTCIKNQPATLKTLEEVSANTDENALVGANAVKELNESLNQVETLKFLNNRVILKRNGKMRILNLNSVACTYGSNIPELQNLLPNEDLPSNTFSTMGSALVDGSTRTYYSFVISMNASGVISGYAITGSNSFTYPQNYSLSGTLTWFVD